METKLFYQSAEFIRDIFCKRYPLVKTIPASMPFVVLAKDLGGPFAYCPENDFAWVWKARNGKLFCLHNHHFSLLEDAPEDLAICKHTEFCIGPVTYNISFRDEKEDGDEDIFPRWLLNYRGSLVKITGLNLGDNKLIQDEFGFPFKFTNMNVEEGYVQADYGIGYCAEDVVVPANVIITLEAEEYNDEEDMPCCCRTAVLSNQIFDEKGNLQCLLGEENVRVTLDNDNNLCGGDCLVHWTITPELTFALRSELESILEYYNYDTYRIEVYVNILNEGKPDKRFGKIVAFD